MQHLRGEEEWARQLMELALGVPVEQHDDGSGPGMHDLEVVYSDHRRAAVEVAGAVDPSATEIWNVAYRGDDGSNPLSLEVGPCTSTPVSGIVATACGVIYLGF